MVSDESETALGLLAIQAKNGALSIAELNAGYRQPRLWTWKVSPQDQLASAEFLGMVAREAQRYSREEGERINNRGFVRACCSTPAPATTFDRSRILGLLGICGRRGGRCSETRCRCSSGGIVTRPTNALIGEAGPEAVIPLDRLDAGGDVYVTHERGGQRGTAEDNLVEAVTRGVERAQRRGRVRVCCRVSFRTALTLSDTQNLNTA